MSTRAEIEQAIALKREQGRLSWSDVAESLRADKITTVSGREFSHATVLYYKDMAATQASYRLRQERLKAAQRKGRHTKSDWQTVLVRANGHCECCGNPESRLQKDHLKPLSSGGSDGAANLRAVCRRCNLSRGPWPYEFNRMIGLLRRKLGEDVAVFGERFERCGRTVEDWEQGRRQPDKLVKKLIMALMCEHSSALMGDVYGQA